jgi:hypothetical protein
MAMGAARSRGAAAEFLFLAAAGHHGLLPLLHQPREWPVKVVLQARVPSQSAQWRPYAHSLLLLTPRLSATFVHMDMRMVDVDKLVLRVWARFHMPRIA